MSYYTDVPLAAAKLALRTLNGEMPHDLPVHSSQKTELVINITTTKALGLTFPSALLVCADEVIV